MVFQLEYIDSMQNVFVGLLNNSADTNPKENVSP